MDGATAVEEPHLGDQQQSAFDFFLGEGEESGELRIRADREADRARLGGALGYRPVLMETFVDPEHYEGSCYKGANWHYLGETTGEGLVRPGKRYTTSRKKIFVRPLVRGFRSLLCSEFLVGREVEE